LGKFIKYGSASLLSHPALQDEGLMAAGSEFCALPLDVIGPLCQDEAAPSALKGLFHVVADHGRAVVVLDDASDCSATEMARRGRRPGRAASARRSRSRCGSPA
jgi:hypothetical protein